MGSKTERVDIIQALRFVAALLVVCFHLPYGRDALVLKDLFGWGGFGVDLFFVISGFIITYTSMNRSSFDTFDFLRDRADRIYPVLWVTLIMTIAISMTQSAAGIANDTAEKLTGIGYLSSFFLLPLPYQIMPVAWTLAIELMFYGLFAIAYKRGGLKAVSIGLLGWYACSFFYAKSGLMISNPNFWVAFHTICLEFLFGLLIAVAFVRGKLRYGVLALVLGLGSVSILLFVFGNLGFERIGREFSQGIPAALIIWGCVALRPRTPAWLMLGGEASYSLYLTHTLTIAVCAKLFPAILGVQTTSSMSVQIGVVVVCILVSIGFLMVVERPLRGILKPRKTQAI
ncbi:MAG: acyltransferase [Aliishimia sp.]